MQISFFSKPVEDKAASAEAGRPIFKEVEMCKVWLDRFTESHYPAHEPTVTYVAEESRDDTRTWAQRYPNEYRAFKEQLLPSEIGTPVEQWPLLGQAKVSELKALGIDTVEQIANMGHRNREILGPGAAQLMEQAKAYIDAALEAAPANKAAAEIADLKRELEALRAERAEAPAKRGPGRPKKEEAEAAA